MKIQSLLRFVLTIVVVTIAAVIAHALWRHYMYSPWTRDGRVRAEVVRVAPDVSGLVAGVMVRDNQQVRKGDLLFVIDQARFRNAVEQAEANVAAAKAAARAAGADLNLAQASAAQARAEFDMRQAESLRRQRLGDVISEEMRTDARATALAAQAGLRAAQASHGRAGAGQDQALAALMQAEAALSLARLNLQRTEVRAPMDGYITNLDIYPGDYVNTGNPRLALVGGDTFWVYGYFEETKLPHVRIGDPAEIRLMSGAVLHGRVESLARGISDRDNPTGVNLLADVNPTFSWVRLAQRVPVRIHIDPANSSNQPLLAAGMTVTVILHPRH